MRRLDHGSEENGWQKIIQNQLQKSFILTLLQCSYEILCYRISTLRMLQYLKWPISHFLMFLETVIFAGKIWRIMSIFELPVLRLQRKSPMVITFPGGQSMVMAPYPGQRWFSDGPSLITEKFRKKNSFKLRFDMFMCFIHKTVIQVCYFCKKQEMC